MDLTTMDTFRKKLAYYNLSPLNIETLSILLENGPLKSSEIQKKIPQEVLPSEFSIKNHLAKLLEEKWITTQDKNQSKYSLSSKNIFQQKLEEVIKHTEEQMELQKTNYYELIDIVNNINNKTKKNQSGYIIPEKAPEFLKQLVNNYLKKHQWNIIKIETNMKISLTKELIDFRLHAVEFEWKTQKETLYGGVNFCQMETDEEKQKLLKRIHAYNASGREFQYKLEKKNYIDGKNRELSTYKIIDEVLDAEAEENCEEFISKIHIANNCGEFMGEIITFPLDHSSLWICTIWAENEDFKKKILKSISKVKL